MSEVIAAGANFRNVVLGSVIVSAIAVVAFAAGFGIASDLVTDATLTCVNKLHETGTAVKYYKLEAEQCDRDKMEQATCL